jgi:hypothetical protein
MISSLVLVIARPDRFAFAFRQDATKWRRLAQAIPLLVSPRHDAQHCVHLVVAQNLFPFPQWRRTTPEAFLPPGDISSSTLEELWLAANLPGHGSMNHQVHIVNPLMTPDGRYLARGFSHFQLLPEGAAFFKPAAYRNSSKKPVDAVAKSYIFAS